MNVDWKIIRDAWVPYMGEAIATERARGAAQALQLHGERDIEEESRITLTRCFASAQLPLYGGLKFSGSTIVDAVNDVMDVILCEVDRDD
ncbi:MAG: hypothetical protein DRH30_15035 [Deltaproteobacteria bacterium]|nr:MAG: hypothetical protein DRH30_15035 [Deltaproteobacteria bacterium]